ncbi:Piwi domain-containing protein [Clostridium sp.]|uniref:Piwi domain-containing protein n=1 Tax=Clostridium sp. TaxID=1506 RepID=UPI002615A264|nr:Piwi domain-containing protein [Clostridium sp.]
MSNLTIEAFKGIGSLKPMLFYKYNVTGKGKCDNFYKIIKSARYKMHSRNMFKGVFIKDDKLYTLEKFEDIEDLDFANINFEKSEVLNIEDNKDIYGEVVKYYINLNLKKVKVFGKYNKYKANFTEEILGNTILTKELKEEFKKSNKGFELKRKFRISPVVNKLGHVILYLSCSADFSTKKNIYEMMKEGLDVTGLAVKNEWANINGNLVIESILETKITEPTSLGQSLIDYYKNNNQAYRIKNFTEEDLDANVINVKANKRNLFFIPHALKPIITREYLSKNDSSFSKEIEPLIKMNMNYRYETLKAFVRDIGVIEELNNLSFENKYYEEVGLLGYSSGKIEEPVLVGSRGIIKNKMQIFSNGFYKLPEGKVKFGVLYPKEFDEISRKAIRAIYDFSKYGKYHGERNKYIPENLMNVEFNHKECIFEGYKLGDITEYKKAALKLKKYNKVDFVVAVVPDMGEEEIENSYNPFKKIWAELNLPSQMISVKTAEIFAKSRDNTGLYYLHNIVLGILGKIGGIPWVVKDMKGEVDCFVGLDVGTREKGIHYPACSVVFDKYGKLINYYKPNVPQSGEKINTDILQEIFDKVLISYEEENGAYPQNIVIHRDGFSREDLEWYEKYFGKKNIKFNIIEVKKSTPLKIANIKEGKILNPEKGSYILKGDKAYMVTTDIKETLGSPKPLKIEKSYGDIDMLTVLHQIYALTQIHVGSTKSLRLPITTGYADKICKAIEFIPQGRVDNRLFFL